MFAVEPTGEIRKLFSLFVVPEAPDKIDARQFFLSANNFTGADKDQKVQLTFTLFDEDHSGTISEEELIEILKANHMVGNAAQVLKKAQTIMAQGDTDGSGEIEFNECVQMIRDLRSDSFPFIAQFNWINFVNFFFSIITFKKPNYFSINKILS